MREKISDVNLKEIPKRGRIIYETSLKEKLEPEHKGEIVVIDIETGEYFLGSDLNEADEKAREKYPNKVFYAVKIGFPALYVHKKGFQR